MAKILCLGASLGGASLNKKLILNTQRILSTATAHTITAKTLADYPMPVYSGDSEEESGVPAGAQALGQIISESQALIISSPEYNGSIPGGLKNAIDWVSRLSPMPLSGKPILILGASPGALGAVRGLWHTRVPFEVLGNHVFPEMFGLPQAHQAFDESGKLKDAKTEERLGKLLSRFVTHALLKA